MNIALLHPNPDSLYDGLSLGYRSNQRVPETWAAVLDSWQREYAKKSHRLVVLNPYDSNDVLAQKAAEFDLLGMADWYSNHMNCMEIACKAKQHNPELKTVLGGSNASLTAPQTMKNHGYIDFIISRDGADAFVGLVDDVTPASIPNLWYRSGQELRRTFLEGQEQRIAIERLPLWDFRNFEHAEARMEDYLAMIRQDNYDPWLVSPICMFGCVGCEKAIQEGPCSFCYQNTTGATMSAEKLWKQVTHLDGLYAPGVKKIVYMADDIFVTSIERVRALALTKPQGVNIGIRAYGFLPYLTGLQDKDLASLAKFLKQIGVFNLFFGSENYDNNLVQKMNKKPTSVEDAKRVVAALYEYGCVKSTMSYIIGYSGENKMSLEQNLRSLEEFVKLDGALERLYISRAIPFKGTPWCKELEANAGLAEQYLCRTGKVLVDDDYPDYEVLSDLAITMTTEISLADAQEYIERMQGIADGLPQGGFLLRSKS